MSRREVGILAVRLLDPAPARVAGDVEHGRERVPGADRQHPPPDRRRPSPRPAPGRTPPPRRSTAGTTVAPRASRPWSVSSWRMRRDAQPGLLDEEALDRVAGLGRPGGVEVRRPGHAADLADARSARRSAAAPGRARSRCRTARTTTPSRAGRASRPASSARAGRRRAPRSAARRRGSGPRSSSSALHRAGRQAADDLALGDGVERRSPGSATTTVKARIRAWSDEYWVEKFMTPSGRVHWSAPLRTTSGRRKAFQRADEREHAHGGQRRPGERQQDPPEEPERAAAVDPCRVLELGRDAPEERPQDDDRERQRERRLGQRHAERVAGQPDVPEQDEQRQDRDGGREQQPEHEQREQRLAAAERIRANTNAASDANTTVDHDRDRRRRPRCCRSSRQNEAALRRRGRRGSSRTPTGWAGAGPGSAASWPLVLKPPSTAYRIGTRIATATATSIDVAPAPRAGSAGRRAGRVDGGRPPSRPTSAPAVVRRHRSAAERVMAPSVSRRRTNRW